MFSLSMLKDRWSFPNTNLHIHFSEPVFFDKIRFLAGDDFVWENACLYILPASDTAIPANPPSNIALFYLKRPNAAAFPNYCWLQSNQSLDFFQILNHLQEICDEYHLLELQLNACSSASSPLHSILKLLYRFTGNSAYIVDRAYKAIAFPDNPELPLISIHWKRVVEHGYLPFDVVSSIIQNPEWQMIHEAIEPIRVSTKEFSTPFAVVNLRLKGEVQWQLFLCELEKRISQGDLDILKIAAPFLLKILKQDPSFLSLKKRYHELFFSEVLSGQLQDLNLIQRQLAPLEWKIEDCYCIAELHARQDSEYYDMISAWINQKSNRRAVNYSGRILIVFHLINYRQYRSTCQLLEEFLQSINGIGGISDFFRGFNRLYHFHKQAREALLAGSSADSTTNQAGKRYLFYYQECMKKDILSSLSESQKENICLEIIRILQDQDAQNDTCYTETLYHFLRHERSLVKTSQAMHIHRNTLVYRIEKILQLLPCDLNDPDIRLRLLLTCEILLESDKLPASST